MLRVPVYSGVLKLVKNDNKKGLFWQANIARLTGLLMSMPFLVVAVDMFKPCFKFKICFLDQSTTRAQQSSLISN